jgi:Na+/H+ antiporter NhaC
MGAKRLDYLSSYHLLRRTFLYGVNDDDNVVINLLLKTGIIIIIIIIIIQCWVTGWMNGGSSPGRGWKFFTLPPRPDRL